MDGRTAAAVLGITQGATRDEIRRAFRARAKLAHPDANGTDEAFVTLRAAADLLLAAAPHHPARPATVGTDPAPVSPPAAAHADAGIGTGIGTGTGAGNQAAGGIVGGRAARWVQQGATRPGAAIDLTDRPAPAPARRTLPAPAEAAAAAFARVLDAELARR